MHLHITGGVEHLIVLLLPGRQILVYNVSSMCCNVPQC